MQHGFTDHAGPEAELAEGGPVVVGNEGFDLFDIGHGGVGDAFTEALELAWLFVGNFAEGGVGLSARIANTTGEYGLFHFGQTELAAQFRHDVGGSDVQPGAAGGIRAGVGLVGGFAGVIDAFVDGRGRRRYGDADQ